MSKDPDTIETFAVNYPIGTVLFREGDMGEQMFVVQSGVVAISRTIGAEDKLVAKLPAGEFFGEMAILNDRPRSATATVVEPARLLVIDGGTFESMLRSRAEIAVRLIQTMAKRLQRANQQIELLLVTDQTHRVVMALRQMADAMRGPDDTEAAVFINISIDDLSGRVAVPRDELIDILERLALAGLVMYAEEAGVDEEGFVVPEVGRLLDFLEFLELKDRYGPAE